MLLKRIKVLYYEPPAPLIPVTIAPMGGVIFGAIAVAGVQTHCKRLDNMPGLEDPILQMKKGFLASMQASLPKTTLTEVSHPLPDDDLEKLKRRVGPRLSA